MFGISIMATVFGCTLAVMTPHPEASVPSAPAIHGFDLPEYPYPWISRGYQGSLRIRLQIDEGGSVSEVTLLSAEVSAQASKDGVTEQLMQKEKLTKWTFLRASRKSERTEIELFLEYKILEINSYCPVHPNYEIRFGPPIRILITGYKALREPDWGRIPKVDEPASAGPKETDSLVQQDVPIDSLVLPELPYHWLFVPAGSISATLYVDPSGMVTRVRLDRVNLDLDKPNYPIVDMLLQKERLLKWTFRKKELAYPQIFLVRVELRYRQIAVDAYCVPPPRYSIHFGSKIEIGITGFIGRAMVFDR